MNENELRNRLKEALEPMLVAGDDANTVTDKLYDVIVDIARQVAMEQIGIVAEQFVSRIGELGAIEFEATIR